MQRIFSVDDLIIDDSFINYCNNADAKDTIVWENYLFQNPGETATVEEAKAFIYGLKTMLREKEKQQSIQNFIGLLQTKEITTSADIEPSNQIIKMNLPPTRIKNNFWWFAAASVAFISILSIWILNGNNKTKTELASNGNKIAPGGNQTVLLNNQSAATGAGQKKVFFLPDSTKVTMNANTIISVDSAFGRTERLVNLEGEAFFDVKHNTASPFIVRLKGFDVKVWGTMFNVRSYAGDKTSEATLVKGKVEIVLKNNPRKKLFLQPNQKVVLYNDQVNGALTSDDSLAHVKKHITSAVIKPLSISSDGSSIIETGWMQNRLEINDETFIELKNKLERKYDVKIIFLDEHVMKYKFTALFENETIEEALDALQLSYPFKYVKQKNQITIGK